MSEATGKRPAQLRFGVLRLTDAAPAIVAHEFGFFDDENVEVIISVEPSWANIADKLAFGVLDAAIIVPPLAFAVELGLRGAPQPLIIPYNISLGGNTITVAENIGTEIKAQTKAGVPAVEALAACLRANMIALGVVHPYSTHNLLLRYWLATAGIEVGRDVKLVVAPPANAVHASVSGHVAGFCAGAPWGKVAERKAKAVTIATSRDIWCNAPEKALAVRAKWADANPDALQGCLRALLRASQFCDAPENASYTAALLSRRQYLNVTGHAVIASLPGGGKTGDDTGVFFRSAATFPWCSHGLWFLHEMKRWGLIDQSVEEQSLVKRVYRPDLYRIAAHAMKVAAPRADWKNEGEHAADWTLDATMGTITMGPDRFCDGKIFAPKLPRK